jgi:hypothetical protein
MRYSPGAHSAHPLAPSGWFTVAIAATVASIVASTITWSQVGASWAAGLVFLAIAATGAVLASRRGREAVMAFVGGTVLTIASVYAALLVMAQIYAVVLD